MEKISYSEVMRVTTKVFDGIMQLGKNSPPTVTSPSDLFREGYMLYEFNKDKKK